MPSPFLWMIGLWEHRRGNRDGLEAIGAVYERRAERGSRMDSVLGSSARALTALSSGDTATAIDILQAITPTAPHQRLIWDPWESLGPERLLLAKLLLKDGSAEKAMQVASYLASPAALPYVHHLPASIAVRLQAAAQLGFGALVGSQRRRLATLKGPDSVNSDNH